MEFAMNESYFHKEMNDNILEEILVRLPLKSLCRFKCVSKPWCRLISDKHFQKRLPFISTGVLFHSESDQFKTPKYAYTSQNGIIENCNLDFFPFNEKSTIVDGCNGLLLYYVSESRTFYVINTVTERWIELPRSNQRSELSILAFNPYSSSHYKVVCFTEWRARGAELEIYSSETGEWGLRKINFGVEKDAISATKHYFNGVLYILAYPNLIVAINLKKSLCDLIRLPEPMNRAGRVGHNQGHLHYAHIDGIKMKIWMLKDLKDPSGWNLKHEIYLMELIESQEIHLNQVNLVAFHPEKDLVYLWVPWKIVNCCPRERKLEGIWEFEKEREVYLIQIWLFPCTSYLTKCLA